MSLTNAMDIALSGLDFAERAIALHGHNISNANTPGYVKQSVIKDTVTVAGVGQGVLFAGISAQVDEALVGSIRDQNTATNEASTLQKYYDQLQLLYGQPGSSNSFNNSVDEFFSAMQELSTNPNLSGLRTNAVQKAESLTTYISSIANSIEELRYDTDREISTSISKVNALVDELYSINAQILLQEDGTSGKIETEQLRDQKIRELAGYVNISVVYNQDDQANITMGNGAALLDSSRYHLIYNGASSVQTLVTDSQLGAITLAPVNETTGVPNTNQSVTIATTGFESTVTHTLKGGTLNALLDLRDIEFPKMLAQMDNIADALRNQVNAIHNDGVSFPPPTTLTGTRSVTDDEELGFSGSVRIAILNQDGTAAAAGHGDETTFRPLDLDLSTLESGTGAGRPTVQTIIDEINEYFGPPKQRVTLGNLRDIRLASVSDNIADEGTFTFDLELDNISAEGSSVQILAATVIDPIDSSTVYTVPGGSLPSAYTLGAGERERTGQNITVDFSGDDDRSSYTIRLQVQVTDDSGNISTAEIDYTVNDNVTSIRNDRYTANGVQSGTATLVPAVTNQAYATASLVDANGQTVGSGEAGFIKITVNNATGQTYGIAIDELDSREIGLPSTPTTDITNHGFSHYFGLNDLITTTSTSVSGSAIGLSIRPDILANAGLIAVGELVLSKQPSDPTQKSYTYELGSGNNAIATRLAALDQTNVDFSAAGSLPNASLTFTRYISDVISYGASKAINAEEQFEIELLGFDGLLERLQQESGVDIDEELQGIIEVETTYRASARVINISQELLDFLLQNL